MVASLLAVAVAVGVVLVLVLAVGGAAGAPPQDAANDRTRARRAFTRVTLS
jgi:hypothetical protein